MNTTIKLGSWLVRDTPEMHAAYAYITTTTDAAAPSIIDILAAGITGEEIPQDDPKRIAAFALLDAEHNLQASLRREAIAADIALHEAMKCSRCGGTGHLSQFNWNMGGECFACGGTGIREVRHDSAAV